MGSHYRFKSSREGFKKFIPKAVKALFTEQENPKGTESINKFLKYLRCGAELPTPVHLTMHPSGTYGTGFL